MYINFWFIVAILLAWQFVWPICEVWADDTEARQERRRKRLADKRARTLARMHAENEYNAKLGAP